VKGLGSCHTGRVMSRDCNPGFEFPIPGSRRDWCSIVKTTKIAKWVTVFGSLFLNYKYVYDCAMDLVLMCCKPYRNILLQLLLS